MCFAYHFSPSHGPLHFVSSHSRVTGVPRSPLAKNEPATTQTLTVGHPLKHAGLNAKENSRNRKPLLYSLTKTEYTSKNATADTFSQTLQCSLDQLLTTIGHKKE